MTNEEKKEAIMKVVRQIIDLKHKIEEKERELDGIILYDRVMDGKINNQPIVNYKAGKIIMSRVMESPNNDFKAKDFLDPLDKLDVIHVTLSRLVRMGNLKRVSRGVYRLNSPELETHTDKQKESL